MSLTTLRSFRIGKFAVIDFLGVIALGELFVRLQGKTGFNRRVTYYLFSFLLGIVVHDILNVKTQIHLD